MKSRYLYLRQNISGIPSLLSEAISDLDQDFLSLSVRLILLIDGFLILLVDLGQLSEKFFVGVAENSQIGVFQLGPEHRMRNLFFL